MKRYTVDDEWNGARIDRYIRTLYADIPFQTVHMLLRKGRILLNGNKARGSSRLTTGDTVEVDIDEGFDTPLIPGSEPSAQDKKMTPSHRMKSPPTDERFVVFRWGRIGKEIQIVYEDDDIVVINKPAGLVVQPGNIKEKGSLLDLLEEYQYRKGTTPERPGTFPYTPVHRLDRQTTGALLVAKTRPVARILSRAFAGGLIEKTYLAVVEGVPAMRRGTISIPLTTKKGERSVTRPDVKGKKAVSEYRVVKPLTPGRALLTVLLRTGRTHQVRAHLASIGHPVVGDRTYGEKRKEGGEELLLHAWRIRFPHPETGVAIEVTAPPPAGFESSRHR